MGNWAIRRQFSRRAASRFFPGRRPNEETINRLESAANRIGDNREAVNLISPSDSTRVLNGDKKRNAALFCSSYRRKSTYYSPRSLMNRGGN